MVYGLYPAVDNTTYQFPPVIRAALADSPELHHLVIPMTEIDRNDLVGAELWNGRLVFNTTSNKINYYNSQTALWYEIDLDKLSLDGGNLLGPLTLSGDPSIANHAANKNYVDTYRAYPGRNRIINGDFSVNQRAVVSASALGQFMADHWYIVMSNVSCSASMIQATLSELPESAVRYLRLISGAQSVAGDYTNFRQSIESVRTFSGKTVTISFWAKAATGTPKVAIDFEQHFGTGGSPSSNVLIPGGLVTIDSTWKRYSATVAIPAITGKTFGTSGTDQLISRLWISAGSTYNVSTSSIGLQNTTVNFWGIQVEEDSILTPYEQKSYADELRTCQRYYYRRTANAVHHRLSPVGTSGGTAAVYIPFDLPTVMRKAPVLTSSGTFNADNANTAYPVTALGLYNGALDTVCLQLTVGGGGLVAGNPYAMTSSDGTSWFAFDAEL